MTACTAVAGNCCDDNSVIVRFGLRLDFRFIAA